MSTQPQTRNSEPTQEPTLLSSSAPRRSRRGWLVGIAIFAVFAAIFVYGIVSRVRAAATVRTETAQMALPSVAVVSPQRSAPSQEIVLPGNVQPFISAPIYSRTNGYLRRWYADIGAHVKKGQLLAEIETPEVDQELRQAMATLGQLRAKQLI